MLPDETGEGRTHDAALDVGLGDGAEVEVDVVHVLVNLLQLVPVPEEGKDDREVNSRNLI